MRSVLVWVAIMGFIVAATIGTAFAEVPQKINYQGRLTDATGNALSEVVALNFAIYSDSLGADLLWSESHALVTVADGLFNVVLGSITPIPATVFNGATRWLGISVDTDPELRPLRPLLRAIIYLTNPQHLAIFSVVR